MRPNFKNIDIKNAGFAATNAAEWAKANGIEANWKTPEQILANKQKLNGMGVNYLLNVGPDALGRIPSYSVDILRRVRELETQLLR